MIRLIFWAVFVAFIVLVLRSKGWEERLAETRKEGKYFNLSLYLLLRGSAALLVLTLLGLLPTEILMIRGMREPPGAASPMTTTENTGSSTPTTKHDVSQKICSSSTTPTLTRT